MTTTSANLGVDDDNPPPPPWEAVELATLRDVTVRYRRARRDAVADVSLSVRRGEVVSLVGPNGAGKTTMLRAVCGFARLRSGTRRLADGVRVSVLLAPSLLSEGFDVDGCVRNLWRVTEAAPFPSDLYAELLSACNLDGIGSTPVGWLSLGQRQRVSVVVALLHRPDLLVLDEPFGPLDPDERLRLGTAMTSVANAGGAVLLTSHDLTTAVGASTRIVVMEQGRVRVDLDLRGEVHASYRITYRLGRGRDRRLRSEFVSGEHLDTFLQVVNDHGDAVLLGVEPTFSGTGGPDGEAHGHG